MKKRLSIVLALALAFVMVMPSMAMAAPEGTKISNELTADVNVSDAVAKNVLNFSTGVWYDTISAAVDAATAEDTLKVSSGTYAEDVTLDKALTITNYDEGTPVITGTLTVADGTDTEKVIDNISFNKPNDADSVVLEGAENVTIRNCNFDANTTETPADRAIQMSPKCEDVTIENCTFEGGYYVTIQGIADNLTVKNSEITDCKSGINLQQGNNLVVENTDISVVAQGNTNDTYCVRFASSSTSENMTITDGEFTVNKNGIIADNDTYHSAIIVRSGASGDLSVQDVTVNGEVIDESGNLDLADVLEGNIFNDDAVVTSADTIEFVDDATGILAMSWGEEVVTDEDGKATFNVTEGESFSVSVTTDLGNSLLMSRGDSLDVVAVDRVLYILEVTSGGVTISADTLTAIAADGQLLGYNNDGYWFWGKPSGFTFASADSVTTNFTVTFNEAGTYTAKIYAVRVPR